MLKKLLFIISFVIAITFQTLEAKAAWGDFDTRFGFQGVTVEPITGYKPQNVVIQPDGKILVTGYRITILGGKGFFLRRYLSNGSLDTSFGSGGAATVSNPTFINADYRGEKIVVQANGKIAVAGRANDNYAVWQFTANGRSDGTFGQNGLQVLTQYLRDKPLPEYEYRWDTSTPEINIQSGKLLLTFPKIGVSGKPIVLIRLNSNGAIDQTFGNLGEALTDLQGEMNNRRNHFGTVIESDEKITIGGKTLKNTVSKGLERRLANGQPDISFSPTDSDAYIDLIPGLVKLVNQKYLLVVTNSGLTFYMHVFNSAGNFESSSFRDIIYGKCPQIFTNQNDGKVLIGVNGRLLRMNADLDGNSQEDNYCSNLSSISNRVGAIQSDDKMLVAGIYNGNLTLVRLLPD